MLALLALLMTVYECSNLPMEKYVGIYFFRISCFQVHLKAINKVFEDREISLFLSLSLSLKTLKNLFDICFIFKAYTP